MGVFSPRNPLKFIVSLKCRDFRLKAVLYTGSNLPGISPLKSKNLARERQQKDGEELSGTLRAVPQGGASAGQWLPRLAWFALIYNVLVILWGAVVRITGAGAGCGDHWPLCNGVVVPQSFDTHRLIEYSHRLTSGASGLVAIGLFAAAFSYVMWQAPTNQAAQGRVRGWFMAGLGAALLMLAGAALHLGPLILLGGALGVVCLVLWLSALLATRALTWPEAFRRWPVLLGAALTFALILLEGVVGGVQVLLKLTATSTDPARGFVQGIHMANTFALLGALLLTALWAGGNPALRLRGQGRVGLLSGLGLALLLLMAMAGAVTALGDLLFLPADGSVGISTVKKDFAVSATMIENLRVVHPLLSILGAAYLAYLAAWLRRERPDTQVQRWSLVLFGLLALQVLAGVVNVTLRAPAWMQLLHLLLACMMWLATVMLVYRALTAQKVVAPGNQPNRPPQVSA